MTSAPRVVANPLLTVILVAFASSLLGFFSGYIPLYLIGLVAALAVPPLVLTCAASAQKDRVWTTIAAILWMCLLVTYFLLRLEVSDFSLNVGDASHYLWDGVHAIEKSRPTGFFPPLTSAVAALGYLFFGISWAPVMAVFLSLSAVGLLFFLFRRCGIDWVESTLAAFIFSVVPLSIWFTKTTFSEPLWQVLVLASILAVARSSASGVQKLPLLILSGFLVLAPWARGTAPFLAVVVLVSVLLFPARSVKVNLYTLGAIAASFALSFYLSLHLREPYLIGWQYSRVLPQATPGLVFALVGAAVSAIVAAGYGIKKARLSSVKLRLCAIVGGILLKTVSAWYFGAERGREFFSYFIGDEFNFFLDTFSWFGVIPLIVGSIVLFTRAALNGGIWFVLVLFYCVFAVPLNLQGVHIERLHDMAFYWHRYYFSEIFLVHFIAVAIGCSAITKAISSVLEDHDFGKIVKAFVFSLVLLSSISWGNFIFTVKNGYLDGSSELMEWVMENSASRPLVIIFGKDVRYGPYDGPFLFGYLPRADIKVLASQVFEEGKMEDFLRAKASEGPVSVVCINAPQCVENVSATELGEYSGAIVWHRRMGLEGPLSYRSEMHVQGRAYLLKPVLKKDRTVSTIRGNSEFLKLSGLLHSGWHGLEKEFVWSKEQAKLSILEIVGCESNPCAAKLHMSAYGASTNRPVTVRLEVARGGSLKTYTEVFDGPEARNVTIDVPDGPGEVGVTITVPDATTPKLLQGSSDTRTLGVALWEVGFTEMPETGASELDRE